MPYINKVYQKIDKKNVVILAVNIKESPFAVNSFKDRYPVNFPILLDRYGDVTDAYNIQPIPTTFFINKEGKVVDKVIESMPSAKYIEKKISQIK
jgi:peroxiredoxin